MRLENWDKALRRATQENDLELLEICIKNGADVNAPDSNGYTPLMKAAVWSHFRAACMLLNNGASVGIKNKKGEMAFDLLNNKDKKLRELLIKPTRKFKIHEKRKALAYKQKKFRHYLGRYK